MPASQQTFVGLMCANCSDVLTEDSHAGNYICYACVDTHLVACERCGDICPTYDTPNNLWGPSRIDWPVDNEDNAIIADDTSVWLCSNCVSYCSNCSAVYEYEDNSYSCCEEPESEAIQYYSFRPMMRFWSDLDGVLRWHSRPKEWGLLYLGIEVEVEKASPYAVEFLNDAHETQFNEPSFVYLKSDGSLGYDGMEIVTQPATFSAFEQRFPWTALEGLHENGARAWFREACGMHIHMSRTAFTPSHLWKFLRFHTDNASFLTRYAGRVSHWGSFTNEQMNTIKKNPSKYLNRRGYVAHDTPQERYSAVNLTNRDTIELRYFRSNITRDGILRNVELVQSIYDYTRQLTAFDVIRGYAFDVSRWFDYVVDNNYGYVESYIRREGLL